MIHYMATKVSEKLQKEKVIDSSMIEIYTYGLELIIATIIDIGTLLILAGITKSYVECLLYLLFLIPIRLCTGGYHASNYLNCNLVFLGIYLVILAVAKITPVFLMVPLGILFMVMTLLIVFRYAPIESPYNPLSKEEKESCLKKSRTIIAFEFLLVISAFILLQTYTMYIYVCCLTSIAVGICIMICVRRERIW